MNDCIEIKEIVVLIQKNGIIRNSKGRFLARLDDEIEFDGEHIVEEKMYSREEMEVNIMQYSIDVMKHLLEDKSITEFDTIKWIEKNL